MSTWVDLDTLSPSVLRHLAAAKEKRSLPHYDDTEAMGRELADMLDRGTRPTVGWHLRHRTAATSPRTSPPDP